MIQPRLLVFASGGKSPDEGGSGFKNLVMAQRSGVLSANIVAVVSNHSDGGVRKHAEALGIPFLHFPKPWVEWAYKRLVRFSNPDFVALSGWLKHVKGLDPAKTFNIHPGPPEFGGPGMYGHHVHEAVMTAFRQGRITCSGLFMHFVTEEYDKGPVIFQYDIPIFEDDTADSLAQRVNKAEHEFQPTVTEMVVRGLISWDGQNRGSLKVPPGYPFLLKSKS